MLQKTKRQILLDVNAWNVFDKFIHTKEAKNVIYVWRGVIYKCYQTRPLFFIVKIDESNLGWVKVS